MVSTSKILTVSYGTFSCTLEGFDDSFDTMKAIAEYFRDLAADDRYFGAEPATPDAEMLARIAEREISRRVEARDTDGKIHLRADPAALSAAAQGMDIDTEEWAEDTAGDTARALPAAAPDAPASPARSAAPPVADPFAQAAPQQPAQSAAHMPQGGSDSIADKLRRIRAVANPGASAFAASDYEDDDNAEDFLSAPGPEDAETVDEAAPQTGDLHEDADAGTAEAAKTAEDADIPSADTSPDVVDDAADDAAQTDEAEAKHAPEAPAAEQQEDAASGAPEASDDDILSRLSAGQDAPDEVEEISVPSDEQDALSGDTPDDAADAEEDATLDYFGDRADGDDTLSRLLADAMVDETPAQAATEASAQDAGSEAGDQPTKDSAEAACAEDEDDAEDAASRPLAARVIKMKRADLDAALESGLLEEETSGNAGAFALSPDAEADLQRELAEVEAELQHSRAPAEQIPHPTGAPDAAQDGDEKVGASDTDADATEAEDAAMAQDEQGDEDRIEARDDAEDRHARRYGPDAPDTQAGRIFDEADTQLGEPESNKRRSAIQHLRAAVAATRAERRAGGAMGEAVDDQPYRNDLQNAVRPRRPHSVTSATPRPGATQTARPAPLRLVAEQRIDTPAAPVRPRRITRADVTSSAARPSAQAPEQADRGTVQGAGSFADYAEQVGASSLTDLLEAAAAYMADVEGTPQFSRPMLMQKLREAHEDDFSREEGLRSFGQLLRQGKLQKLRGGRFAVTDVTEFRKSA
ncbi:hypothetical protein DC366_02015 [Pelagivirga sediminicola]|uniref:Chemotaxis protein CheA n=1 Tax=Pelagivirga sediminicola TaxID=2170575 RepID=A0A2T7GBG1_9RHOB|nr:hypothetical protein [Pelagivirga sediminicola]PVA11751.1 hypothetical protein DC366_02015 [Pelagivirga sediminicola]